MNSTTRYASRRAELSQTLHRDDGFASISLAHPACGTSMRYASGPLDTMSEDIECSALRRNACATQGRTMS